MKGKKVLIVPLNWGLGHTTRIIPIIKLLADLGAEVSVSGSPKQLNILTVECNKISIVHLPFSRIRLSRYKSQLLYLFLQLPCFVVQIFKEHHALNRLLKQQHLDLIISDNCYGLWNKKVRSVFITHQLNIQVPGSVKFLQPVINFINRCLIRNFNYCWVPDYESPQNLSGLLSHPAPKSLNIAFIGILSRFTGMPQEKLITAEHNKINLLFIISGPEVQRTIFESILKKEFEKLKETYSCTFIRGLPDEDSENLPEGWFNHVSSIEMQRMISQSDLVICRSGFSSIMDLISLQKPAVLIPTPGQTEQEYLARYLSSSKLFCFQEQNKINIQAGIQRIREMEQQIKSIVQNNNYSALIKELKRISSAIN
jgi:predicted glycosyltransferase